MTEILLPWDERAIEESYLFNPAFVGVLVVEFVCEFQRAQKQGCSLALPFCALSLSLHPKTRRALPSSTLTSMYTWLERHTDALIGYKERTRSLRPVVQEGIRFAMARTALAVDGVGDLVKGRARVSVKRESAQMMSADSWECIESTRLLGRWFAKAGTTSTVLAAWGLRP